MQVKKYKVQNIDLVLEENKNVFSPSNFGIFFAENIKINRGESVIDVGTGSGFLAILSAKLGGNVFATDISKCSIKLARSNSELNNTEIEFMCGEFFSGFNRNFDVVIANLPQDIVNENFKHEYGKQKLQSIDGGGVDGNQIILNFLESTKKYIHKDSRVYISVSTVSNYFETIKNMLACYDVKIVYISTLDTNYINKENIEWYKALDNKGKIDIFNIGDRWKCYSYILELSLKKT